MFELTTDQLPLLEAAECRHGSKRGALVAALHADAEVDALRQAAGRAEHTSAKASAGQRRQTDRATKATAKLERELKDAKAKLRQRNQELAAARGDSNEVDEALAEERRAYDELAQQHEHELAALEQRAVDHLFCARCGDWAAPSEWTWTRDEDGARYAHHKPCGDHGPGLVGASSWLAHRGS